jgi:hypothetical protein
MKTLTQDTWAKSLLSSFQTKCVIALPTISALYCYVKGLEEKGRAVFVTGCGGP